MCFTRGVRSAQRIADIQLQPPTHHQKDVLKIPYALLLTCIIGAKKKNNIPIYNTFNICNCYGYAINQSLYCCSQNCLIIKRESAGRFLNLICWGQTGERDSL